VRRAAALRDLSDDHHRALVLARRCREAARAAGAGALAAAWAAVRADFASHLEPHFRIEEELLLPALDRVGEQPLADGVRRDHARLRALRAAEAPDAAHVAAFGEELAAHVRREEREVFEVAQRRLSDEALASVAAACRRIPRPAGG